MFEEDSGVATTQESVQDAAVQAPQTQDDAGASLTDALAKFMGDEPEAKGTEETSQPEHAEGEEKPLPGGLKGRMKSYESKGYARGRAEAQAAWAEEKAAYETRLKKLEELEIAQEARELAGKEKIPEGVALRLIRAERGIAAPKSEPEGRDRDDKGRFTPAAKPAAEAVGNPAQQRAQLLMQQNEVLKKATGVDALQLFETNQTVKQKVVSGEWDFTDVVQAYIAETGGGKRVAPARSPNNTERGIESVSFRNMTDEQFEKFNERLSKGYSFNLR